jgi:hypothetical protein
MTINLFLFGGWCMYGAREVEKILKEKKIALLEAR